MSSVGTKKRPDANISCAKFLKSLAYRESDYTVMLPDNELGTGSRPMSTELRAYCDSEDRSPPPVTGLDKNSYEFRDTSSGRGGRLQVSRAFGGKAWSVTVRCKAAQGTSQIVPGYEESATEALERSEWKPKDDYFIDSDRRKAVLFSFDDIVTCLYRKIFPKQGAPRGLVLIAGRTGSGKSEIARGLVWQMLWHEVQKKTARDRRPHLLTYEDPIEAEFQPLSELSDLATGGRTRTIDYTPRQKSVDCADLNDVVASALRQTPTALYVGEIRADGDMTAAVEFAGSGHLVVATCHAGDLVESVNKVLTAAKAQDPATRAIIVPRILAVVHMGRLSCEVQRSKGSRPLHGLVPALYRRSSKGIQGLIADGLFSLLPHHPLVTRSFGSLGRQSLARTLCLHVHKKLSGKSAHRRVPHGFTTDIWRTLAFANQDDTRQLTMGRHNVPGTVLTPLIVDAMERDLLGQ